MNDIPDTKRYRPTAASIIFPDGSGVSACDGLPSGIVDKEERHAEGARDLWIEHAEKRVIFQAARFGFATAGMHMNVLWHPCVECARAIVESGITSLSCLPPDFEYPRHGTDLNVAAEMLEEAGVKVTYRSPGPLAADEPDATGLRR